MYAPSSGRAFVGGYNIRSDLAKVRERLGLCPQHNMLFNKLTVAEHLLFFGRVSPPLISILMANIWILMANFAADYS